MSIEIPEHLDATDAAVAAELAEGIGRKLARREDITCTDSLAESHSLHWFLGCCQRFIAEVGGKA